MQLKIFREFYMNFFKRFLLLILWMLPCTALFAQVDTAFWFAVPKLAHAHPGHPIKLCVSTLDSPATITVTKPAQGNAVVTTFTVAANSSHSYQLVENEAGLNGYECDYNTPVNYGLYIHSTAKVNAYIAVQNNNSEIYALKGNNALGTQFYIPMQNQYDNASYSGTARNSVQVIATENNTTVTITPSVALYQDNSHPANSPFNVMLNKGQVYNFASSTQTAAGHMAGTVITSTKPIVVDVSDDSATPNGNNQDLVADQIVPEELAGTEYIVVPSPASANNTNGSQGLSDYAFIFALEEGTNVIVYSYASATSTTVTQSEFTNLNRGAKRSYHFTNTNPIFVYSNKPILVFQVTGAGNELGGTLLPHVYCTGSTQASYMPLPHPQGSAHVKHIYLTLLCKQQFISGFLINGQSNYLTENDWKSIPGTFLYKYCRKEITSLNTASSIRITNSLGKFHLGVIDYHQPSAGYDDCSISYFSDYSTSSKLAWDTNIVHSDYCQGDTIFFAFDTVDVNQLRVFGPNGFVDNSDPQFLANVMPENTGFYRVEGNDSRNCLIENFTDTIWIDVHPSVRATVRDTICPGAAYDGYGFHVDPDLTSELGIVVDSLLLQESEWGCDSLVTLELTVRDSVKQHTVYDEVCYGEAYNGFGGLFHFPGDSALEVRTLLDTVHLTPVASGCDSLLILELTVRDSVRSEFSKLACNQFTWNGHLYVETGDYIQTLEDANGCDSVVTMHLEIEVPEVEIVTSGEDFCDHGELILTAETDYEEYIWSTGETSPFITVTRPGLYTVTVTEGECQASNHYTVPSCDFNIFMPNAITPSKPDGINDYLSLPEYVHRFLTDFEIEIYDRWGELIYWSNDMNFKWYGENAHVSDVYVWIIRVANLDGKEFMFKGTVTVL